MNEPMIELKNLTKSFGRKSSGLGSRIVFATRRDRSACGDV